MTLSNASQFTFPAALDIEDGPSIPVYVQVGDSPKAFFTHWHAGSLDTILDILNRRGMSVTSSRLVVDDPLIPGGYPQVIFLVTVEATS